MQAAERPKLGPGERQSPQLQRSNSWSGDQRWHLWAVRHLLGHIRYDAESHSMELGRPQNAGPISTTSIGPPAADVTTISNPQYGEVHGDATEPPPLTAWPLRLQDPHQGAEILELRQRMALQQARAEERQQALKAAQRAALTRLNDGSKMALPRWPVPQHWCCMMIPRRPRSVWQLSALLLLLLLLFLLLQARKYTYQSPPQRDFRGCRLT